MEQEIVMAAVSQCGRALQHAAEEHFTFLKDRLRLRALGQYYGIVCCFSIWCIMGCGAFCGLLRIFEMFS